MEHLPPCSLMIMNMRLVPNAIPDFILPVMVKYLTDSNNSVNISISMFIYVMIRHASTSPHGFDFKHENYRVGYLLVTFIKCYSRHVLKVQKILLVILVLKQYFYNQLFSLFFLHTFYLQNLLYL